MLVLEFLNRRSKWLIVLAGILLVAAIGGVDRVTSSEWSLAALYAIPIALISWNFGWRIGFTFAVICTIAYWSANSGRNPFNTDLGFALAVMTRFFYFSVLVFAMAAFKAKSELDRQRIAQLEKMRELEAQVLRTIEREQQRIGRDLHDSLAPHLTAVGYAASFLADELREHHRPESIKAEQIHQLLTEAVTLTRELARGLFPIQFDFDGLIIALEELARTTSKLTGVHVSFHESGDAEINDPEAVLHLHRIAQEAVNNAVKHGKAKNISIILDLNETTCHLTVADDGKGVAAGAKELQHGIGLFSMRYRASTLGGELKIDSNPGEGTVVSCEIPNRRPLASSARTVT